MTQTSSTHRAARSTPLIKPAAFAVLLALSPLCWAGAGKILFASGEVQLNRNGNLLQSVSRGLEINPGDLLITGSHGFAQIALEDGGRVTVRANSQWRLDSFDFDRNRAADGKSFMSLLTGSMRAITGMIGQNNRKNYAIRTPTATVGIRGSDGNIGFDPAIGASVQTLAGGHTLTSTDASGVQHTLILNPGEIGLAPPGGAPMRVQAFPFATTLAPQARPPVVAATTGESSSESSGTASETSSSPTGSATDETGTASTPAASPGSDAGPVAEVVLAVQDSPLLPEAPPIVDDQGGLPAVDDSGNPVVVDPGGVIVNPPGPELGLSPRQRGVISSSAWNVGLVQSALSEQQVDSQLLISNQDLLTDASGNVTGFLMSEGVHYSSKLYISNGIAGDRMTNGKLTWGSWSSDPQNPASLTNASLLNNNGATIAWAHGVAGYYQLDSRDPFLMPFSGTTTYTGAAVGGQAADGSSVTLNSATLVADFSLQQVNVALDLNAGATRWQASANGLSLFSMNTEPYRNSFQASTGNGLTLSNNSNAPAGSLNGQISGMFTGANFSGALLRYDFYENSGSEFNSVMGGVNFSADTTVNAPPVTTPPAQSQLVALTDSIFSSGSSLLANNLNTADPRGWEWSWFSDNSQLTGLRFTGGSVTDNGSGKNGITTGSWTDGVLEYYFTRQLDGSSGMQWAVLERSQAWYLPALLTGTSRYTVDQATRPIVTDGSVWTVNTSTTALDVDFTNQRVAATISLANGQGSVLQASTTDAILNVADGQFFATTSNKMMGNEGTLVLSRDGTALNSEQGWGQLSGQLGGDGLTQALVGYGLTLNNACAPTQPVCVANTSLAGLVSFTGAAQAENTPYVQSTVAFTLDGSPWSTIGYSSTAEFVKDSAGVSQLDVWPDFGLNVQLQRGSATVAESGSDSSSGLSWGRWSGTATATPAGAAASGTAENVHYIYASGTGPAQLPISGVYSYTPVGHTSPTNQAGVTGTLDNATLTADFTNRLVDVAVTATVAGTTLSGNAQDVKLFDNAFHATNMGGGTGQLQVNCNGSCGSSHYGAVTGQFTPDGGVGAGLSYSLGTNGATPTQINGVVGFKRAP